ncbi:MAG TPA: FecR family protein [Candidatus Mcinerneyibacterium sp.]|nr:FecR family protein [Candidatus Mcinerneyibacterium sp.]
MKKFLVFYFIITIFFNIGGEIEKKGVISALEGNAQKRNVENFNWLKAKLQMDVKSNDVLRTLPESFAEISLLRGTKIRLAPKTMVNMVKLYEEKENQLITEIEVEEGEIWGNVNKENESEVFEFGSTSVSTSVVGTIFRINSLENGALIKVYKGNVKVKNRKKKGEGKEDKPMIKKPTEVEGPREVEGPKEVSMEEWVVIVDQMMALRVEDGEVVSLEEIDEKAEDEKSNWVIWNKKKDGLIE